VGTAAGTISPDKQLPSCTPQQPSVGQRVSYQDIVNNVDEDEDEELIFNHKPKWQGRGGRKNKNKKNKKEEYDEVDWDAIYDPAKPSNLARYQGSTEQDSERAEWTHFLHCQKALAQKQSTTAKPKARNSASIQSRMRLRTNLDLDLFAPPANLSFAPPAFNDSPHAPTDPMDIDDDDEYYPPPAAVAPPTFNNNATPSWSTPSGIPQDFTGDDVYMRRLQLSGMSQPPDPQAHTDFTQQFQPPDLPVASSTSPPSGPPTPAAIPSINMEAKKTEAHARLAAVRAKINAQHAQNSKSAEPSSTPPQHATSLPPPPEPQADTSTIIKAPVRYNLLDAQVDTLLDREDARPQSGSISKSQSPAPEQARSKMPGQKGFGARMMAKMGWAEGQGLGAKGEGITTAIIAQPSKRKRRSDKDGGGWAQQPNMGKIVGGKKAKAQTTDDDSGEFGTMSYVVKLHGMLDELDVAYEIEEKNLMQEIGEEFSKSFGAIERLFVWREEDGGNNAVFVKFNSQLSALNACNGRNGMTFAGNPVAARFYPTDKFEAGEYA
jgi:splicing factor 45